MALKDWKLELNRLNRKEFYNNKTKYYLIIYKDKQISRFWKVRSHLLISPDFKSKSQALKFAKAYMRTH